MPQTPDDLQHDMSEIPDFDKHRHERTPEHVPPDDITVRPIDSAVADVKVLPAAEVYPASPTMQQLTGVGARMPEVVKRLRTRAGIIAAAADAYRARKRVTASTSMVVADLNSYALALRELADFAETGK